MWNFILSTLYFPAVSLDRGFLSILVFVGGHGGVGFQFKISGECRLTAIGVCDSEVDRKVFVEGDRIGRRNVGYAVGAFFGDQRTDRTAAVGSGFGVAFGHGFGAAFGHGFLGAAVGGGFGAAVGSGVGCGAGGCKAPRGDQRKKKDAEKAKDTGKKATEDAYIKTSIHQRPILDRGGRGLSRALDARFLNIDHARQK